MKAYLLAATLTLTAAAPSVATTTCGDHKDFVNTLAVKFQEHRLGLGLVDQSHVVELFVSKKGTWTMLLTTPAGKTCVLATGQDWQSAQQPKGEGGA